MKAITSNLSALRGFDVWAMSRVEDLLSEVRLSGARLKAMCFINRGELQGSENEDTAALLRDLKGIEFLPAVVMYRKTFGHAQGRGLAITELKEKDPKAIEEISILFNYVFNSENIV